MSRRRNRSNANQIGWHSDDAGAQINYVRGQEQGIIQSRAERKRTNPKRKLKREAKNERKGTIDNIGNLLRVELMPQLRQTAVASHSRPPSTALPLSVLLLCMCHKTTHISLCSQLKEKLRLPTKRELRARGLSLRLLWQHTLLLNEQLM